MLLPLSPDNNYQAEVAFLNGVVSFTNEVGIKSVARLIVDGTQNK